MCSVDASQDGSGRDSRGGRVAAVVAAAGGGVGGRFVAAAAPLRAGDGGGGSLGLLVGRRPRPQQVGAGAVSLCRGVAAAGHAAGHHVRPLQGGAAGGQGLQGPFHAAAAGRHHLFQNEGQRGSETGRVARQRLRLVQRLRPQEGTSWVHILLFL